MESGKSTERQNWYLLKFSLMSVKKMREALEETTLEFFLPSYTVVENRGKGLQIRVERALMFNMLFIHTSLAKAVEFVTNHPKVSFMVKHAEEHPSVSLNQLKDGEKHREFQYDDATFRYVITIPDNQMDMFIKAVTVQHNDSIPFMKPTEVDLAKGDKVRIIGGPYDGVEGILESQQGKDGGTVFVHIQNFIATRTTEIRPEFIEIIEFAKDNKHMYKKFDSFMTRGHRCVMSHIKGEKISSRDDAYFRVFVNRFANLKTPTVNMTAKLWLFMFIAYKCLDNAPKSEYYEKQLADFLPKISSSTMLIKCCLYLYGCTGKKTYRKQLSALTKPWRKSKDLDEKKKEIKQYFQDFDWVWKD